MWQMAGIVKDTYPHVANVTEKEGGFGARDSHVLEEPQTFPPVPTRKKVNIW